MGRRAISDYATYLLVCLLHLNERVSVATMLWYWLRQVILVVNACGSLKSIHSAKLYNTIDNGCVWYLLLFKLNYKYSDQGDCKLHLFKIRKDSLISIDYVKPPLSWSVPDPLKPRSLWQIMSFCKSELIECGLKVDLWLSIMSYNRLMLSNWLHWRST